MGRNISENLKATIFLGIATFLTSAINYITTPIFTPILSTAEYGLVSKYNSVYLIISVVATLTLARPGILSVGLYEHKDNRWKYISSMLGEVLVASIATFFVLTLVWGSLEEFLNIPFLLMIVCCITCAIQPAMTFWTFKQRYEYKWKSTFLVNVLTALVSQTASVLAVLWFKEHSNYNLGVVRIVSAAIVNLAVSLVIYIYIVGKGKKYVDLKLWKKTLLFAIPLIPHYFGFALLTGTDKIMIGYMVGDDKAGIYSLAAVISTVGALLWQALCVSITPFVYENLGGRQFKTIDRLTKPVIELVAVFCLGISFLGPEIISFMGTKEYAEAAYIMPAATAGTFLHVLYDLFSHVAFFNKKSVYIMCATLVAATANVVLNYIFISRFGYLAAGYTTLISYIILAFIHYRITRHLEKERIFSWKYSFSVSIIVIAISLSSMFLYETAIARYIIIAALLAFLLFRRKKYISALNAMKV